LKLKCDELLLNFALIFNWRPYNTVWRGLCPVATNPHGPPSGKARGTRTRQNDKISHIDTIISHIDTVVSHIDTVVSHVDTVISHIDTVISHIKTAILR